MNLRTCITLFLLGAARLAPAAEVPALTGDGYPIPQPGAVLSFPAAHGSHPDFKIEWWYLTGHLHADSGERFGFQATFFRRAQQPPSGQSAPGPFNSDQLHLAHMAITDVGSRRFLFEERFSRDGWDAWAKEGTLDLRNGSWTLRMTDRDTASMQLQASVRGEALWSLTLVPAKPLVRFGQDGTSRKGDSPASRSYYLSFTRLQTSGTVTIGGRSFTVEGSSWMDHEIASSQLEPGYTGWDWVAIQFRDGWELKAYLLRMADGSTSPWSALIWIDPSGNTHYKSPDAFSWTKDRLWESPATGAAYPIAPLIRTRHPVSGDAVAFRIEPLLEDQELVLPGTTYWEGAGRVLDASGAEVGSSYLELVGYAGPIEGLE